MGKTKIAWTERTWNPVTGCSKISPGCQKCYAERMALRFAMTPKPWTAANAAKNVKLHPERLADPRSWKKPQLVFVNSMSDLFHPYVPFEFIDEVFEVIADSPKHTFQILTKRPERLLEWYGQTNVFGGGDYLTNVWLGVSVENQKAADERIPLLLSVPAVVHFLSCEPLLEPVDLSPYPPFRANHEPLRLGCSANRRRVRDHKINWVIVGGESGPNHRFMDLAWARAIRDECAAAGVHFFYKQGSALRPGTNAKLDGVEHHAYPQDALELAALQRKARATEAQRGATEVQSSNAEVQSAISFPEMTES